MLPAYAGMIRVPARSPYRRRRAPSVCGDDPVVPIFEKLGAVCSPRMRG